MYNKYFRLNYGRCYVMTEISTFSNDDKRRIFELLFKSDPLFSPSEEERKKIKDELKQIFIEHEYTLDWDDSDFLTTWDEEEITQIVATSCGFNCHLNYIRADDKAALVSLLNKMVRILNKYSAKTMHDTNSNSGVARAKSLADELREIIDDFSKLESYEDREDYSILVRFFNTCCLE